MPTASPVTQLRLQTSTRGRPIPLAYGMPRLQGNLIWYGDLVATAHEENIGGGGKGGGGGGQTSTSYTYAAAILMALGEVPLNAVTRIWRQKEVFAGVAIPTQTFTSSMEAYTVPASGQVTVAQSAYFTGDGGVQTLGQYMPGWDPTNGVWGFYAPLTPGVDYTVSAGVYTIAPALLPSLVGAQIFITYNYTINAYFQDACAQLGLTLMKGSLSQVAPGFMTTKHPTEALSYRGISYVAGSSFALSDDAHLPNLSFEVATQTFYSAAIPDANPPQVLADVLANPWRGAGFPLDKIGDLSEYSRYCVANNIFVSPAYTEQEPAAEIVKRLMIITNSEVVHSEGKIKFIPYGDVATTANGVTYTPNLTPVYDLTEDDFQELEDGDPVRCVRKPAADAYNHVRVKFYNRAANYNEEIAEAKDDAHIGIFGIRSMDVVELKEVCDLTSARTIAQLILQRVLYVRCNYEFKLGWRHALLEPMDLVTLTEPAMDMDKTPVRIKTIEEDDESGDLLIEAEEFPLNVANAAAYATQQPAGYAINFNVAPGNASTPVIFEPPIELAVGNESLDIWIAAAGAGADYGGCEVWLSLDNATYKRMGRINGRSRYGSLSASLASQASPGIASQTMSVTLIGGGQMLSGTLQDAQLLNTLCYVNGEFMAYQTATLTGANAYNLSTLNRGAFGTGQPAHSASEKFVRIDDAIAKIPLTLDYIGKTIYVKLLAFNKFGSALQSLADVSPTTYAVTGYFVKQPPPNVTGCTVTLKPDDRRVFSWNTSDQAKDVVGYRIKRRTAGSGTAWASMTLMHNGLLSQSPYETANPPAGTYDFAWVSVDRLGNESASPVFVSNVTISAEPTKTVFTTDMVTEAATELIEATNAGPVASLIDGCAISFTPPVTSKLVLTFQFDFEVNNSTADECYFRFAMWGKQNGVDIGAPLTQENWGKVRPFEVRRSTISRELTIPAAAAGVAQSFSLSVANGVVSSPYVLATFSNLKLKAEIIKR